jgi:hypothetical protein
MALIRSLTARAGIALAISYLMHFGISSGVASLGYWHGMSMSWAIPTGFMAGEIVSWPLFILLLIYYPRHL